MGAVINGVESDFETRFHMEDGKLIAHSVQDAKPYADRAHQLSLFPEGKDMKLAMHIPAIMVEKYINDHGITMHEWMADPEHAKRMLNDPNLAAFRVWKGKV